MAELLRFLEKRPLLLALFLCAAPYVGLRLYLAAVMHAASPLAEAPGSALLLALVGLGTVAPIGFLCLVLRRLVLERTKFELRGLLEVYFSLILVFAVTYAVLQAGATEPAFAGMPAVWEVGRGATADVHLERLHAVFGNSLYLSAVTMTTVGFGDISPLGFTAKALTAVQGLIGIGFVGLVLGQYFAVCLSCAPEERTDNA